MIFVLLIIFMAYNRFSSGYFNFREWLYSTLLLLPAIVIGLTFHEFAHAYSAYKLGDYTPKAQNRVTLNPLSHIDPVGIAVLILAGFGWGRPVQVNPLAFKGNKRRAGFIVSIAGVAMNFVIAFICAAFVIIIETHAAYSVQMNALHSILVSVVYINIVLMFFNLLPIPPLDGFGIITELFDLRRYSWHRMFYDYGMFILLALLIFGFISKILMPAVAVVLQFIYSFWFFVI